MYRVRYPCYTQMSSLHPHALLVPSPIPTVKIWYNSRHKTTQNLLIWSIKRNQHDWHNVHSTRAVREASLERVRRNKSRHTACRRDCTLRTGPGVPQTFLPRCPRVHLGSLPAYIHNLFSAVVLRTKAFRRNPSLFQIEDRLHFKRSNKTVDLTWFSSNEMSMNLRGSWRVLESCRPCWDVGIEVGVENINIEVKEESFKKKSDVFES